MSIGYNPKIVTSNLIFYIDAANKKSYPGSGNVIFNALNTITSNSLTVNSTTTWNAANGGGFVCTSGNVYINVTNGGGAVADNFAWTPNGSVGSKTISVEYWWKTANSANKTILSKPWNGGGGYNWQADNGGVSVGPITTNYLDWYTLSFGVSLNDNKPHQLVIWIDPTNVGFYIDGGKYSGSAAHGFSVDNPNSATNSQKGISLMNVYPYTDPYNGSAAQDGTAYLFRFYNKVLTADEVKRNFNAHRSRYGI